MRFVLMTLLTLTFTCSAAGLARADASPFPGPPETCTTPKKEQPGTDCEVCAPDMADDDSATSCADEFAGTDYQYVCTGNDWPFNEVWCDGPPRETACSLVPTSAPSAMVIGVFCGLSALGLAVLLRRRG